ncbi:MAG: HD domain-containing protein [Litorilinea sp.]
MSTLERAIELAARAHAEQVDKAGQPYILHPLRLMLTFDTATEPITTEQKAAEQITAKQMAAVLHDIVEDTPVTFEDLVAEGFPEAVIAAVRALTKRPGEDRLAAARRAAADPIARAVKLADVTDNMNLDRIPYPSAQDRVRQAEYEQVRALLLAHA